MREEKCSHCGGDIDSFNTDITDRDGKQFCSWSCDNSNYYGLKPLIGDGPNRYDHRYHD